MEQGDRIRAWLTENRITNKELAEKLNLTSGAISSIMSGRVKMSVSTCEKLIKEYPKLCVNWVLLGDSHPKSCPYMTGAMDEAIRKKDEEIASLKKHIALQQDLIDLMKRVNP